MTVRNGARLTALVAGVLLALLVVSVLNERSQRRSQALRDSEAQAKNTAAKFDKELGDLETFLENAASEYSSSSLPTHDAAAALLEKLKPLVAINPQVVEVGVALVPTGKEPTLYAPHYGYVDGQLKYFDVGRSYDYTQRDWYSQALKLQKFWCEPYLGAVTNVEVMGLSIAVVDSHTNQPWAVIRMNYSMDRIKNYISSLGIGSSGYGYLLSPEGAFVGHPSGAVVQGATGIAQLAEIRNSPGTRRLAELFRQHVPGVVEERSFTTGQQAWMFIEPIPKAKWSLIIAYLEDEVQSVSEGFRRILIWIVGLAIVVLAAAYVGFVRADARLGVGLLSILFVVGVAVLWGIGLNSSYQIQDASDQMTQSSNLKKYLSRMDEVALAHKEAAFLTIPTGVYVRAIDVKSSSEVAVTAIIWQKFEDGILDGVGRGFVVVNSSSEQITEIYKQKVGRTETIGWLVRAVIRQNFDFSHFPIDQQTLRIQLRSKEFAKSVLLVPDLESYPIMAPRTMPGMDRGFSVSGWDPLSSYFDFSEVKYSTNFGLGRSLAEWAHPELRFNVVLRRYFLAPFLSNVLPWGLIAVILNVLLIMITCDPARKSALDFKPMAALGSCSALFFAALLVHVRIRGEVGATRSMIYLEYFYFVMYAAIMAVTLNAYLFPLKKMPKLLEENDNRLAKLIYWPLLCGSLFLITAVVFY